MLVIIIITAFQTKEGRPQKHLAEIVRKEKNGTGIKLSEENEIYEIQ